MFLQSISKSVFIFENIGGEVVYVIDATTATFASSSPPCNFWDYLKFWKTMPEATVEKINIVKNNASTIFFPPKGKGMNN